MGRLWANTFWKVWSELFIWNGFSVLQFSVQTFLWALPVLLQRCKAWKAPGATTLGGRLVNAAALSQRGKQSFAGFCRGCCYPASPTACLLNRNVVCKCQVKACCSSYVEVPALPLLPPPASSCVSCQPTNVFVVLCSWLLLNCPIWPGWEGQVDFSSGGKAPCRFQTEQSYIPIPPQKHLNVSTVRLYRIKICHSHRCQCCAVRK